MYKRKDSYYTRAKHAGYRSRAAYKLLELQRRYRLLRRGDHVVDLGAAPGAWLQVASELVGPHGRVVGLDIVSIPALPASNATCIVADVGDPDAPAMVLSALGRQPTVVLSDMAPKLTGIRPRDEAQCAELQQAALDFAVVTLAPGGRFLMKVMSGTDAAAAARPHFETAKLTRPEATRKGSAEYYLVATGFRG
jgi:23S rRNA (uridine2552-2'-O)-methyltransferase